MIVSLIIYLFIIAALVIGVDYLPVDFRLKRFAQAAIIIILTLAFAQQHGYLG